MPPIDNVHLLQRLDEGLPYGALDALQRLLAISTDRIAELVRIAPRTLIRRKEQGRLSPAESDRLVSIARLVGKALDLFEADRDVTMRWLATPQPTLGGATPLAYMRTETGARAVEDLIGRLEQGVYS